MMHCVDCPLGWQYHWPVGSGQLTRKEAFKQLEEKPEAAAQADAETEDSWRYVLSCRKCFCFLPASLNCYISWRYALSCHKWFWTCLPLWTTMCLHAILCASFVFWLAGGMRFHAVRWIAMCLHSILCASFVFWFAGGMHFHAMNGSAPSCLWTAMCLHTILYAFLFDFQLLKSHLSVNAADSMTRTKGHSKSYFWDCVFCQLPGKYYWSVCKSMQFLLQSETTINLVWKQSKPSFWKACVPKTKPHAGIKYKSGKMVAASISTPFHYQVIQQMKVRLVVLCCAVLFVFTKCCCMHCSNYFKFLCAANALNVSTFLYHCPFLCLWHLRPPCFAGQLRHCQSCLKLGAPYLWIFSPLSQNLGGCTLCLEMPRSLEAVVHNYIVFLFLFWITEWRGKIWIRSWCESVASVTCWLLNSSTTRRHGQTR